MIRRYQEQSFKAESEKKEIHVYVNGKFADVNVDYKTMYVELDWGLADILSSASQRLNIPTAKRLYNADGVEINDVMMIMDEDMLFLSNGEEFAGAPKSQQSINASGGGATARARVMNGNDSADDDGDINANDDGDGRSMSGGIHDKFAAKGDNLPPMIGNYKVSSFLGRGGFGVVRVGKHQLTEERVALKFINKSDIQSIAAAERTMTEIQCLTTLKHNNIILLNEYVETAHHVVLMFELMLGGDLLAYLKSQERETIGDASESARISSSLNDDAPPPLPLPLPLSLSLRQSAAMTALPEEDARTVFYQVISAVSFAHNHHICHRDLKLENILLKKKGSLEIVKVADFGLSDFYRPGSTRKSNCGTLAFLAPEGFRNTSNAGPPLDVWSLGVILFALLFGRLPFDDTLDRTTERDAQKPAGVAGGRYDLEERDKDNARREEGGRALYNNKDVHAGTERHRLSETRLQGGRALAQQQQQQPLEDEVEAKEVMQKKKLPRPEQVIRAKIARCQYSFDPPVRSHSEPSQPRRPVSLEARDLIRRMLVLDPDDRASVPEICSHIWTRSGVENHHNHPTPRGSGSGKSNKGWRSRSSSASSEDMGSSGDKDKDKDNEKVNSLPGIPVTSPLVRQHGKGGAPAALTRQMSREQYEIPEDERIEILGSGKLAFGSLALTVPGNEDSILLDAGDVVDAASQSNSGKNDHNPRDATSPAPPSTSGNSSRRISASVNNASSDKLSSLVYVDNDDTSVSSRRGSVNDVYGADNGNQGITAVPVLVRTASLPTGDALTRALSESHNTISGRNEQQQTVHPHTTPVTTPVQTHSSIALAGGSSLSSLPLTSPAPSGIPPTASGSILMPLRRLPVPVRSFDNDDYLRGKNADENDSLGQLAQKLSPRLSSTSEKVSRGK